MKTISSRLRRDRILRNVALISSLLALSIPLVLVLDVLRDGVGRLSLSFFSEFASRFPEEAGIRAPLAGTLWILGGTAVLAFPVSVGAAIYLEEYAPRNWITRLVGANIASLASVPSIVYGILGLAVFVQALGLGRSVISGALTLSILVMPMIILSSQEAIRSVPRSIREGAYAVGATRWQVVRFHIFPLALPGILSGALMALARAVGETAPLIMIGVLAFIAFSPHGPTEPLAALPVQIFNWITRGEEFHGLAAGGIIVLLGVVVFMNVVAIWIQRRYGTRCHS